MIDLIRVGTALTKVIPKIRTYIQLSSLSIGLVIFLVAYNSNPPNLTAQLAAGLIGGSVLLFTLSLNALKLLPADQRARFILYVFFGFLVTITVFFVLAIYVLLHGDLLRQRSQAELLGIQLRDMYSTLQKQSEQLTAEKKAIEFKISRATAFADLTAFEAQLAKANLSQDETVRRLDIVTHLLEDLDSPNPKLAPFIARAQQQLGIEPARGIGLITAARASGSSATDEADVSAQILKDLSVESDQYLSRCMDAAWAYQIRGDVENAQAIYVRLDSAKIGNRTPRVLEGRAELEATRGNFSESLRWTDDLISAIEEIQPVDLMALALALKDRASRSWAIGDFEAAEKFFRRAVDAYEQSSSPRPVVKANIDNEVGYYFYIKGQYRKSYEFFENGLRYFDASGSSNYGKPHTFDNAAVLLLKLGRLTEAERHLTSSMNVQEAFVGRRTRLHATILFNFGQLFLQVGKYQQARQSFDDADIILERWKVAGASKQLVDISLAYVDFFTNDRRAGLDAFRERLAKLESGGERTSSWPVLLRVQLARLYRIAGNIEMAASALAEVDRGGEVRSPGAWRDYLIERETLRCLQGQSNGEFGIAKSSADPNEIIPVQDQIRLSFIRALRAKNDSKEGQATAAFCEGWKALNAQASGNQQLIEEARLVGGRIANPMPVCV